ncbi:MAG: hypothetical protein RL757_2387 [Bacteroidota bacterium]|jgi:dihydropteroate synthase
MKIINCGGQLLDLTRPKVMGILNVTPDSFFDGGQFRNEKSVLIQTEKMLSEGAAIIDIGGMSSRPNAEIISEKEELNRVLPAIRAVLREFPKAIVSIDTFRANVARASVAAGATMVNDISAGELDPDMFKTMADLQMPYVMMHMRGTPKVMQNNPTYDQIQLEILDFFIKKLAILGGYGLKDIIADVGFGFGKTLEHNYILLKKMTAFQILDLPLLAGVSRKSMIYKLLDVSPNDALNGTTAAHMLALQNGANLLRVHDVKPAIETIKIYEYYSIC